MKTTLLFILLISCFGYTFCQTKLLDASVNWNSPKTLTIYFSDSLPVMAQIRIGSDFDGNDILNSTFNLGTDLFINDNILIIPLSGINPGDYYVDVLITMTDASIREMQFQTSN